MEGINEQIQDSKEDPDMHLLPLLMDVKGKILTW